MADQELIAVVKRDCPTCAMIAPVLGQLARAGAVTVYSQDDPSFPETVDDITDDTALDRSYELGIEIVPTLIRKADGARVIGWNRAEWRELTGIADLGHNLPENRPGCGALNQEPARLRALKLRHGDSGLSARSIEIGTEEDEIEACYDRDWSDGLPVVPPTPERVLAMLEGTSRQPDEVLGEVAPNLVPCTVEKVAINAVLAGCRPEYMPVLLAAVEGILDRDFNLHGVLATTRFVSPLVIVNGPVARAIGMNAKHNALGQGNRANATIGRAVNLVVRNVGGGKPGGVDRSTLGSPGKYTYCFAEDEDGSAWTPFSVDRGLKAGANAVTVFAGSGLQPVIDERARTPDELAATFAGSLRAVDNINRFPAPDTLLVVCPEHERTLVAGGWDKARLREELMQRLTVPADTVMPGANGIRDGVSAKLAGKQVSKFPPHGLLIVRAGGGAGKFSAIVAGFTPSSEHTSRPVTKEVKA